MSDEGEEGPGPRTTDDNRTAADRPAAAVHAAHRTAATTAADTHHDDAAAASAAAASQHHPTPSSSRAIDAQRMAAAAAALVMGDDAPRGAMTHAPPSTIPTPTPTAVQAPPWRIVPRRAAAGAGASYMVAAGDRLRAAAAAIAGDRVATTAAAVEGLRRSPPPRHGAAQYRARAERRGAGPESRSAEPVLPPTSDDEQSDTSTATSDTSSTSSRDSRFSTECTCCNCHIARGDNGNQCDVIGCRATRCEACMPEPTPYLCKQHGDVIGVNEASTAAMAAAGPSSWGVAPTSGGTAMLTQPRTAAASPAVLVRALPSVLAAAAKTGIEAALATLGPWQKDPDMLGLVEDLTDTLEWGSEASKAKGAGALRRLDECLPVLPAALRQAVANPDIIDIVLSAFVSARLRVHTARKRLPEQWTQRPVPEPTSIRGEVNAIIGLLRVAALLPADPRGSVMRTRRIMRKTGCLDKHAASPRGYTFLWELATAWDSGIVPRDNPQAVAAMGLFVNAVQFLLRPRYARAVSPLEIRHEAGGRYRLRWGHPDKTRPKRLGAADAGAVHPAVKKARAAAAGTGAAAAPGAGPCEEGTTLPAKHPRLTGSQGKLLHEMHQLWRPMREALGAPEGPLFCRVEIARQTRVIPLRAVLTTWAAPDSGKPPVNVFVWPYSMMSEKILKRWLVQFLTPIIGAARASKRVLSGLRGGGEMELTELLAPVSVRATVGWWVARRLSAEGALVTYEGSSMESMWAWTCLLGTLRLRVLAPGVFRYVPHACSRSARLRLSTRRTNRDKVDAARRTAAATAAPVPAHAAPHAAAAAAGAASCRRGAPAPSPPA